MRNWKYLALAIVNGAMGVGSGRAEVCNNYCSLTTVNVNVYIVTIKGDVRANLNLNATASDPGLNPFEYAIKHFAADANGTTTVTAALDSNGNTVVTFKGLQSNGTTPISLNSSNQFSYGAHSNGQPHIGLDGSHGSTMSGGGPALNIISQGFSTSPTSTTSPMPGLSVSVVKPPMSGPVHYITFFADVTSGGNTVGQWFELPYTNGTAPKLTLTNYTNMNETLSNVGFMTSPTLIPLDNLNFGTEPPPGTPGSTFTPLPQYDGNALTPGDGIGGAGGTITTSGLVPEPSSIIPLATGLVVVAGYFGLRRVSARPGRTTRAA